MTPINYATAAKLACNDVYRADELGDGIRVGNDTLIMEVHNKVLYIAICGTSAGDLDDWRSNVDITHSHGMAKGLYVDAAGILAVVNHTLFSVKKTLQCERIVWCGHSRGGALALTIYWLRTATNHQVPVDVVTFGAPRPFYKDNIRNAVARHATCFEHKRDPAPHWPPHFSTNKKSIKIGLWFNIKHFNWLDIFMPWRFIAGYFKAGHAAVGYELAARKYQAEQERALTKNNRNID